MINVDALAQEIRRVDGNHDKGAAALAEALMPFLTANRMITITDEMVEAGELELSSVLAGQHYVMPQDGMRCILTAALAVAPAEPTEIRHEEGGYVEFLNEDVPTVVLETNGHVAILTTLEKPRRVVGYRVYGPGCSPAEVFAVAPGERTPQPNLRPITLDVIRKYFECLNAGDAPDPALALYSYLLMDGYIDKSAAKAAVRAALRSGGEGK